MEDLNQKFWNGIMEKYPEEHECFSEWIRKYLDMHEKNLMEAIRYYFDVIPPAVMLGVFIQYTMEHDPKRNWFQIYGYGSVADQITRWFEAENRKNKGEEIVTNRHYLPTQL